MFWSIHMVTLRGGRTDISTQVYLTLGPELLPRSYLPLPLSQGWPESPPGLLVIYFVCATSSLRHTGFSSHGAWA